MESSEDDFFIESGQHNKYWNKGYATENVMKKIGLRKIRYFQHPRIEEESPLKPHVLYRIHKEEYKEMK